MAVRVVQRFDPGDQTGPVIVIVIMTVIVRVVVIVPVVAVVVVVVGVIAFVVLVTVIVVCFGHRLGSRLVIGSGQSVILT